MKMKLHIISRIVSCLLIFGCSYRQANIDYDTSTVESDAFASHGATNTAIVPSLKVNPSSSFSSSLGIQKECEKNIWSKINRNVDSLYYLYGTISWETNAYKTGSVTSFPLINAEVDIYKDSVSNVVATTRTDDSGYYQFNLKDNPEIWNDLYNHNSSYKLMVVLKSDQCVLYTRSIIGKILPNADYFINLDSAKFQSEKAYVAGKAKIEIENKDKDTKSFQLSLNYDSSTFTGQAFQLYTMLQLFSEHAKKLNSSTPEVTIPACNLYYPCEVDKDKFPLKYNYVANYSYDNQVINVPLAEYNRYNPKMYSYNSWDVIGHEYGHHIAKQIGFKIATGDHYSGKNDCSEVVENNIKNNTKNNPITYGRNLAWCESWPTFFFPGGTEIIPVSFQG